MLPILSHAPSIPRCKIGTAAGQSWPLTSGAQYIGESAPTFAAKNDTFANAYGVTLKRVTIPSDDPGTPDPAWIRNFYGKRQPYNADNTYRLSYATDGYWYVYNTSDNSVARKLSGPAGDSDINWHPTDPDLLVYNAFGASLIWTRILVSTGGTATYFNLGSVAAVNGDSSKTSITAVWATAAHSRMQEEGAPSWDWRYWAFLIETSGGADLGFCVYDRTLNEIVGTMNASEMPNGTDYVGMAKLGSRVIIASISQEDGYGIRSYPRNFASFVQLHSSTEHADTVKMSDGSEVIVLTDFTGLDANGALCYIDIATGTRTDTQLGYDADSSVRIDMLAHHVCGECSYSNAGYVLIGTQGSGYAGNNFGQDQVFLIKLNGTSSTIYVAAETFNAYGDYDDATQASVSRDGTRITFNTTMGGTNPIQLEFTLPGSYP